MHITFARFLEMCGNHMSANGICLIFLFQMSTVNNTVLSMTDISSLGGVSCGCYIFDGCKWISPISHTYGVLYTVQCILHRLNGRVEGTNEYSVWTVVFRKKKKEREQEFENKTEKKRTFHRSDLAAFFCLQRNISNWKRFFFFAFCTFYDTYGQMARMY